MSSQEYYYVSGINVFRLIGSKKLIFKNKNIGNWYQDNKQSSFKFKYIHLKIN